MRAVAGLGRAMRAVRFATSASFGPAAISSSTAYQRPLSFASRRRVWSRSSSTSNATGYSPRVERNDRQNASRLNGGQPDLRKLSKLIQDLTDLAAGTGTRGFTRSFQAAQAVAELVMEEMSSLSRQGPLGGSAINAATISSMIQDPKMPPRILRRLFEKLGATYIKLGQFIGSSPTLFPREYVEEFQKCLDKAPPIPYEKIKSTIEADLGKPVSEVFSYVDTTPLATASIAQVHTAILKDSNKEVVIKVLKPGVEDILVADLSFIYGSSLVLEWLNPELSRTSLSGIVSDIRNSILDETDFRKEARNLKDFDAFLSSAGITEAVCPQVYEFASGRSTLTMDKLNGVTLTDLDAIAKMDFPTTAESAIIVALNTWMLSLIACQSFHADVHGGNLMLLRDGRVGFIDFGIVGKISKTTWQAVEAIAVALPSRDYDTLAKALVQVGATGTEVDVAKFSADLRSVIDKIDDLEATTNIVVDEYGNPIGASSSLNAESGELEAILLDIFELSEKNGLKFPREFGLLLKQLLYFDRYMKTLAPKVEVLSDQRVRIPSADRDWRKGSIDV